MITVTEEAKDLFMNVERPDGTVLRLDPVVDQGTGETQIGISAGEPMSGDQVVEHQGETLRPCERGARRQHPGRGRHPPGTGHRHHYSRLVRGQRSLATLFRLPISIYR
jgi:hypothetical protein